VKRLLLGLCLLLAGAAQASAANIKLLTTAAFRPVVLDLIPAFEKQTGHKVTVMIDTTGGVLQRLRSGDPFDVVVATQETIESLDATIVLPDSAVQIARVGIGVAVNLSAPQPNIFSVEAFRQTLLQARHVAYADPTSGLPGGQAIASILQSLGISSDINRRAILTRGSSAAEIVARGEADIALLPASEVRLVPSARFAGLIPAPIQVYTTYAGAISTRSREQDASVALMSALTDPAMEPMLKRRGLEMP